MDAGMTTCWHGVIPESVRWLMSRGRFEDASTVVQKAATHNGVQLSNAALSMFKSPPELNGAPPSESVETNDEVPEAFQFSMVKEMLTSKILVLRLIVNFVCWISCTVVYYGLSLGSVTLSGDRYVNFAVIALVEAPGNIIVWPMMECAGRRITLAFTFILAGILCIIVPFLPNDVCLLACVVAKAASSGASVMCLILTTLQYEWNNSELPLGGLFTIFLAVYGASLPYIVFGSMALIAGFSSFILPETLNQDLPDSVKEAEELGWKNRKKKASTPQT